MLSSTPPGPTSSETNSHLPPAPPETSCLIGRQLVNPPSASTGRILDGVTIVIPSGVSPGERYGVVWAQVSAPSTTQSKVRLVNRVGVQMYVSVGGRGTPPEFTVGPLAASRSPGGIPVIVAEVHNTGQAALDITGELTLSDGPGGVSAGPFPVELGTLLAPDHSATERGQLPRLLPVGTVASGARRSRATAHSATLWPPSPFPGRLRLLHLGRSLLHWSSEPCCS